MMNDRPPVGQHDPDVGLCAACRHARVVPSARQSRFWLCQRSFADPCFQKYPPLPVRHCAGYEQKRVG